MTVLYLDVTALYPVVTVLYVVWQISWQTQLGQLLDMTTEGADGRHRSNRGKYS
jgi:hypothetical protein